MTGVLYVSLRQHGNGTDTDYKSAYKVNSGEEHSTAASTGIRTRSLSISSPALIASASPIPTIRLYHFDEGKTVDCVRRQSAAHKMTGQAAAERT